MLPIIYTQSAFVNNTIEEHAAPRIYENVSPIFRNCLCKFVMFSILFVYQIKLMLNDR
jgi:hypothetical protein